MFGLRDESQHAAGRRFLKAPAGATVSQSTQIGWKSRSEESMVWVIRHKAGDVH